MRTTHKNMNFNPTHRIHSILNEQEEILYVRFIEGGLYTEKEIKKCANSDWEIYNGELLFRGSPSMWCEKYWLEKI